ncbi:DUF4880 domain-containing protein [Ketobacter sp. MCCC 1A13808]|uniref:FecR domain-containing protein n=1 Tax=Ketobacter sp. MCCC 1A13808 TaxID=2602738 RepID=UPI0012EC896C|nr:FecR domain-containing protein [Ketobacter sp. MCCC 1A13808]MVF14037.1 DUF4880 domain-containing protein [Ketobacter sp. MCCC 1A13808]
MANVHPTIIEAAATWYVDLQNAGTDESAHQAHQQWLLAHPQHRQAWARVEKLQHTLSQLEGDSSTLRNARNNRRQTIKALSLLLMVGGTGLAWQQKDGIERLTAQYHTNTGELRTLALADGGELLLNTNSHVDINYSTTQREIRLHGGEILVTTAQDALNRPFIVRTRHGRVRALGTRFSVRDVNDQTRVDVYEQAVEIQPADSTTSALRLEAGQRSEFTRQHIPSPYPLPANSDAWRQKLLIVSDWPLPQFLTELSRYRTGHLGCNDAATGLRISGAFNLTNTSAVLDNLANTLPIKIRYFTRYWVQVELA